MTNRAFEDLERRCAALNRKRFFKRSIWSIVLVCLMMGAVWELNIFKTEMQHKEAVKQMPKIVKQTDVNRSASAAAQNVKSLLLNTPSVVPNISDRKEDINKSSAVPKKIKSPVKETDKAKHTADIKMTSDKKAETKIKISVKTMPGEASLLESNKMDEDFDSTLKLSQYYLKAKKYEKAIFYSKKANHYDPSSAKPWLIYAKAKIRQNKRDEAIKALETYLSYFSSDAANNLLVSIKGKI